MKKFQLKRQVVAGLLGASFVLGASGCSNKKEREVETLFTVTFKDGENVTEIKVKPGDSLYGRTPAVEKKEGYLFDGWTVDGYDYDLTTPIYSDLVFESNWVNKAEYASEKILKALEKHKNPDGSLRSGGFLYSDCNELYLHFSRVSDFLEVKNQIFINQYLFDQVYIRFNIYNNEEEIKLLSELPNGNKIKYEFWIVDDLSNVSLKDVMPDIDFYRLYNFSGKLNSLDMEFLVKYPTLKEVELYTSMEQFDEFLEVCKDGSYEVFSIHIDKDKDLIKVPKSEKVSIYNQNSEFDGHIEAACEFLYIDDKLSTDFKYTVSDYNYDRVHIYSLNVCDVNSVLMSSFANARTLTAGADVPPMASFGFYLTGKQVDGKLELKNEVCTPIGYITSTGFEEIDLGEYYSRSLTK